jgi:hypothetical protein
VKIDEDGRTETAYVPPTTRTKPPSRRPTTPRLPILVNLHQSLRILDLDIVSIKDHVVRSDAAGEFSAVLPVIMRLASLLLLRPNHATILGSVHDPTAQ